MIPVKIQPEPAGFDRDVRQRGVQWLNQRSISLNAAPPDVSKLPTYWRNYNEQLHAAYRGVCSYLAFYFEFISGASTTDHFIAKSRNARDAYEWDNYRLACLGANQRKNKYDDVLDPFTMQPETFHLNLVSGEIIVNPAIQNSEYKRIAEATIKRLDLNNPRHKQMRVVFFTDYIKKDISERYLQTHNPFVYCEAKRQGLL
ncbi:hypothetical protein FACS1894189_7650 [Planctomycetales bacterium]|nr:hypothetical protein FACS1894189_7650 [Planctomycetales bacterium]